MSERLVVNMRIAAYDVYIGRSGAGESGPFGNPYIVGKTCVRCFKFHPDGGSTLKCFEAYLYDRADTDPKFRAALQDLRGKRLGCFCPNGHGLGLTDLPFKCHGQIILQWLAEHPETT